jgi:hypothetical protein
MIQAVEVCTPLVRIAQEWETGQYIYGGTARIIPT